MPLKKSFTPLWLTALLAPALQAQIVLDNFNSGTATGSVVPGSSWVGQVTQNATSITVGGSATDVNGWQALGLNLNATGMSFIAVTGQNFYVNSNENFTIEFHDPNLNSAIFSAPTASFVSGATVNIPITSWGLGFDFTHITDWSIGGGSSGAAAFNMRLDNLQLVSAVPEPSTYAACAGFIMLAVALVQRKRDSTKARADSSRMVS